SLVESEPMTFEAMTTLFFGVALLAAKPGPGMMTVATKAMGEGLGSVLAFMVGTNLVKIIFFVLVVMGYGLLPERALVVSIALKAATAAYLIWLGAQGFKKRDPDASPHESILKKKGFTENFTAGFMLTIANPFDILFFAGVLPAIFKVQEVGVADYALCAFIIVLADCVVALSYAVPIALSRRFIPRAFVRNLNLVASLGLIFVGLYIGATALPATDMTTVMP
ncbi:MAG: LysE family translocator, partial [Alphaproteobacteria bacterium]|nr:LysE family translocator [Alphaproteobacteria bacterium]